MATTWNFTGGSLPSGAALTRASVGTYFNASGVLTTAAANVARFDHDPASANAVRGILIEPSVASLQTCSNDLSQTSAWTLYQSNFSTTTTTFVDGVGTFGKVFDNYAYDNHWIQTASVLSTGDYPRVSFFITEDGWDPNSSVQFFTGSTATDGTQVVNVGLNLSTQTVSTFEYGNNSAATGSGFILALPDGVYFVSLEFSGQSVVNGSRAFVAIVINYGSGDATTGALIGGVNLKRAGSLHDSYIQTTSAAATRAADALTITIPSGATQLLYTFDDGSTQTVSVSSGSYAVPTNLNRPWIKTIQSNETGGTTATGAGSATGNATTSGVGSAIAKAAATAAGVAGAAAIAIAIAAASGSSTGIATVSGAGVSSTTVGGTGAAAGSSITSATGASTTAARGLASGSSAASGVSAGPATATGSSAGVATAFGVGAAIVKSAGVATGASSASGNGTSAVPAVGVSAGQAALNGYGVAVAKGVGTAAGSSIAAASSQGIGASTGSAAGHAAVSGVGASIASASGLASGSSGASGTGTAAVTAAGSAFGQSSALGSCASIAQGQGTAAGYATAAGRCLVPVVRAMSLQISSSISGSYTKTVGAIAAASPVSASSKIGFADGSGSSGLSTFAGAASVTLPASFIFAEEGGIPAGQSAAYALHSGVVDFWGGLIQFAAIRAIYVEAEVENASNLIVGGGSWTAPFVDTNDQLAIRPGQIALLICQDANGWMAGPTADTLILSATGDCAYTIAVIGS